MASEQWTETGIGALVLAAAAGFLIYALAHAGGLGGSSGYEVSAKFGEVGALASGADVRLAGVKVGTVTHIDLDPKTFLAKASMVIDPKIQLPTDSTVKITQDSLLGGEHLAIEPGGSLDNMKAGSQFQNVQGAVDLFGLIGQVLRPQGGAAKPDASAAPAAAPASAATAPGG
jgi:phospholipid/cholesterol/gamma-HCH transport system substrate-binding protein